MYILFYFWHKLDSKFAFCALSRMYVYAKDLSVNLIKVLKSIFKCGIYFWIHNMRIIWAEVMSARQFLPQILNDNMVIFIENKLISLWCVYRLIHNLCALRSYVLYRFNASKCIKSVKCKVSHNLLKIWINWAVTRDFQQYAILTSVDSDEPVQPPFKFRNLKWGLVSSLTVIEYLSDQQRLWSVCAYVQAGLSLCWSHIPSCWKSHATAQFLNCGSCQPSAVWLHILPIFPFNIGGKTYIAKKVTHVYVSIAFCIQK